MAPVVHYIESLFQSSMKARDVQALLKIQANPAIAKGSTRFFKTGKGEYGEGDQFLGIRVPVLRKFAKTYANIALNEVQHLLRSPYHEERLLALLLLVQKFTKGDEKLRTVIFDTYLNNTRHINNWDLVDSSAYHIVGPYLEDKSRELLYDLAESNSLWERRIAIMATLHFIRKSDFEDVLALSLKLIDDREDLMHKAVGWMLREVGNRNKTVEKYFLKQHYQRMPRTMLRYAIEKFPPSERQRYLRGEI